MSFYKIDGRWYHGPWLKRLVNPILRALQFWHPEPYVIFSKCTNYNQPEEPRLLGYGFGRVRRLPRYRWRLGKYRQGFEHNDEG